MQCSLFFLLRGRAGAEFDSFRHTVADEFDMRTTLKRKSPPHVSLKYDFDVDEEQMRQLELALEIFVQKHHASPARLDGLGHFDVNTIFARVVPSVEMLGVFSALVELLEALEWVQWRVFEKKPTFHATLVRRDLTAENFPLVWEYCQRYKPMHDLLFDNIAICPLVDGMRVVRRVYEFTDGDKLEE